MICVVCKNSGTMRLVGSLIFCLILLPSSECRATNSDSVYIVDNSNGLGRRFDGIGAISGGGATSKLLVNYPEQQKSEILDFLFKPNYGASLHIFKVEIGGDGQSSDGGEASHMHESWDENYKRGYEWELLVEAKKRNPDILLFGLPWSFPAWIGNGTFNAFANVDVTADYVIKWIVAAQTHYNLTLDYIGIWNERNYSSSYIKTLRKQLDTRGLDHVRICAPDQHGWLIADEVMVDKELANSIDFIGTHYPDAQSSDSAKDSGKQLWSSEDHGFSGDSPNQSANCRARMLNLNYIIGKMTATIYWNLISSYYVGLPHTGSGIMTAVEPWSGHYTVDAPVWITAHTTQFTRPGWVYLADDNGVGKLSSGGSYVTLTNTTNNDVTIIIETMTDQSAQCIDSTYAWAPQNATFRLEGGFKYIQGLLVWYSKLGFNGETDVYFQQKDPIQVINGEFTLSLGLNEVYTVTTVSRGQKGTAPDSPPSQPFPLPYKDDFDSYRVHSEAYNLAQQVGIWEVTAVGAPHGNVIRQVVTKHPVYWCWGFGGHPGNNTVNVIGNYNWTDIEISIEARVPTENGTDGVFVAARINQGGCPVSLTRGIFFIVFTKDQKYQVTSDLALGHTIAAGHVQVSSEWNTYTLKIKDNVATGMLNGQYVFNANIPAATQAYGFPGFGTVPYGLADFDNLELSMPTGENSQSFSTNDDKNTLRYIPKF